MDIALGGTYLNGYGDTIHIVERDYHNHNYPFVGDNGKEYTVLGGCITHYALKGSLFNLVEDITHQSIGFIIKE